jgi:hypothetical protein
MFASAFDVRLCCRFHLHGRHKHSHSTCNELHPSPGIRALWRSVMRAHQDAYRGGMHKDLLQIARSRSLTILSSMTLVGKRPTPKETPVKRVVFVQKMQAYLGAGDEDFLV